MKNILYCAIGKDRLVYDTLYSIKTLFHISKIKNIRIIVYTDRVSVFLHELKKHRFSYKYPIIFEEINESSAKEWMNDYIFKVKIYVLQLFFSKYKENVLFVDGDMLFLKNMFPLFELIEKKEFIMYDRFSFIWLYLMGKWGDYKNVTVFNEQISINDKHYISTQYIYYLSGVLGINYLYADLLERILIFCDDLYDCTKYRNSEQVAFSCVLQSANKINTAKGIVYHSSADIIKYLVGFVFNINLNNNMHHLKNILDLSGLNIDINFIERMNLEYDDIICFCIILQHYMDGSIKINNILADAIDSKIINNTPEDHNKIYKLLEKFKTELSRAR